MAGADERRSSVDDCEGCSDDVADDGDDDDDDEDDNDNDDRATAEDNSKPGKRHATILTLFSTTAYRSQQITLLKIFPMG